MSGPSWKGDHRRDHAAVRRPARSEGPSEATQAGPSLPAPSAASEQVSDVLAVTSGRPTIELNADLEHRIEQLAAERCRHAPEPCDACTNLAVWAVQTLVASGLYAQLRRYQSRPRPQEHT